MQATARFERKNQILLVLKVTKIAALIVTLRPIYTYYRNKHTLYMRTAIAVLFIVSTAVVYYWLQKEYAQVSNAFSQSQEAIIAAVQAVQESELAENGENCTDDIASSLALLPISDTAPSQQGEYVLTLDSNYVLQRSLHPLAALFEKITPPSQHYEINSKKEAVIKSKLGTVVTIPSNCFVGTNGKLIEGKIDIELKELFSTSDLLLANVSSNIDDGLWATEGAFYIDATANGKKLKINPEKWIYVRTNINKTDKAAANAQNRISLSGGITPVLNYLLPDWWQQGFSAFRKNMPAQIALSFSGREVFEQLKSYDTMLRRIEQHTIRQAPPINFEDTIQQHIAPKYRGGRNIYVITQTGWTNINRYLPINKPQKSLRINIAGSQQQDLTSSAFLVFKSHKTILPGKIAANGSFIFNGVPMNEKAYIVGLGYKNNQPYIDISDIDTGKTDNINLSLRATTFDMLKYQISQLN